MAINYTTKNTFVLRDLDGDATYLSGKGKTTQTVTETIYPTVFGEDGFWEIHAGAADDTIDARLTLLDTYLYGDTGNDTIYGGKGWFNHLEGGDGNDLIDARLGGTANPYPTGRSELLGGTGMDILYGGWGEDFLDGGVGRDTINAGDGNDTVVYDANDAIVEADGGRDVIDASSAAATNAKLGKGVTIDLGSTRDIFFNFEGIIGSRFNDTLTGDNADNMIDGGGGKDVISAGGGRDYVIYDANDTSVDGGFDRDLLTAWDSPVGITLDLSSGVFRNFEDIEGTRFDDTIRGDANINQIGAGDGNDFVDGRGGADNIDLGYGNDTWVYDPADQVYEYYDDYGNGPYAGGIDTIDASSSAGAVSIDLTYYYYRGFENIIGSSGNDTLAGGGWDNVIEGGAGADTISGGGTSGNGIGDTASYAGSAEAVTVDLSTGTGTGGDAEGDVLSGISNLVGSASDDVLTGNANANLLEGGAGADQLDGGPVVDGQFDLASYAASTSGITASLADPSINTGDAAGDTYSNIQGLMGSSFDDILIGDDQHNVIVDGMLVYLPYNTGPGPLLGKGDDWIDGGAGVDELVTGAGNDTVVYDADDVAYDYGDRDVYGNFVNTFDTVDASNAAAGVTIALPTSYSGFERIIGSAFDDTLIGNGEDNVFIGGAGADVMDGGPDGVDTASYAGSAAGVTVDLGTGPASGGDAEGDILTWIDNLVGSALADTLTGDANDNVIEGGAGADQLGGGDGNDTASYAGSAAGVTVNLDTGTATGGDAQGDSLSSFENVVGSDFADTLTGDSLDNRIEGGGGADAMNGGSGMDWYAYRSVDDSVEGAMDTITGFSWGASGGDILDLRGALQEGYTYYVAYYTTAFSGFDAIKAEAQKQMGYGADIFVGTDGTDTYMFASPLDFSSGPVLAADAQTPRYNAFATDVDAYRYDPGSDLAVKLAGVNDLTSLAAENFYTGGYVEVVHLPQV